MRVGKLFASRRCLCSLPRKRSQSLLFSVLLLGYRSEHV